MISSLFHRLMITTLLPACVLVMVLASYFSMAGLNSMEAQLFQHGQDIVRYMAPNSEYGLLSGNRQALQNMVQIAMEQRDVRGAAISSVDGQISAISGRLSLDTSVIQTPPVAPRKIAQGNGWVTFAAPVLRTTTDEDSLFLLYSSPKPPQGPEVIGQIVLELDTTQLMEKQKELMLEGIAILIPSLLVFGFFTARMARSLIQPILRLADAAKRISEGQTDTRVPEDSKDEIGYLERGFNHMIDHVNEAQRTLQQRVDEATAQLAYQARHDPLTGLINRREFETRLETALGIVQSGGAVCSVLFIDLDRFKKVNDVAGHLAGDELLRRVAKQLQNRIRETDTLARLGGDEFAVLLNDCSVDHAEVLANTLCHLVAAYHFPWEDKVFTIGASIGVVEVNSQYQSVVDVIGAGDFACYAAKTAGKNRVEVFRHESNDDPKSRDISGRNLLESAVSNNAILYETSDITPTGQHGNQQRLCELQNFVRNSEYDTPIPLLMMMETAERCELAHIFDIRLLQEATQTLQRLETEGVVLFIRIASPSLRHPEFLSELRLSLSELGPLATQLCLFIAEEAAIHFPQEAENLARLLRDANAELGLDDFGGWMGSFKHLLQLKPNFVRITTTLTRDIHAQRGSVALVRAIQEIAQEHQFLTIATAVTDDADRLCLESLGIHYQQSRFTNTHQST